MPRWRLRDALQRPAQRVFADDLVHAQCLRGQCIASQRGDVRMAPVPGWRPSIGVPSTSNTPLPSDGLPRRSRIRRPKHVHLQPAPKCCRATLRAGWARRYRARVNPEIEAASQAQRSPGGSCVAVRTGTAATILPPQISRPDGSLPGRRALRRRLKFLCGLYPRSQARSLGLGLAVCDQVFRHADASPPAAPG